MKQKKIVIRIQRESRELLSLLFKHPVTENFVIVLILLSLVVAAGSLFLHHQPLEHMNQGFRIRHVPFKNLMPERKPLLIKGHPHGNLTAVVSLLLVFAVPGVGVGFTSFTGSATSPREAITRCPGSPSALR